MTPLGGFFLLPCKTSINREVSNPQRCLSVGPTGGHLASAATVDTGWVDKGISRARIQPSGVSGVSGVGGVSGVE